MIVIFDLDGTLVNTYPVVRKTLVELFAQELPNFIYDEKFLEGFFGPPLEVSFYNLTKNDFETKRLTAEYRRINEVYYEKELSKFPGVDRVLDSIRQKHKLAILSNRIQSLVDLALKSTKIDKYFDVVLGVDSIPKPKPYPDGLFKILDNYHNKKAVYIGDAKSDIITAKNAGIISIGVTWALTSQSDFEEIEADYIVNNFEELLEVLEEINV